MAGTTPLYVTVSTSTPPDTARSWSPSAASRARVPSSGTGTPFVNTNRTAMVPFGGTTATWQPGFSSTCAHTGTETSHTSYEPAVTMT